MVFLDIALKQQYKKLMSTKPEMPLAYIEVTKIQGNTIRTWTLDIPDKDDQMNTIYGPVPQPPQDCLIPVGLFRKDSNVPLAKGKRPHGAYVADGVIFKDGNTIVFRSGEQVVKKIPVSEIENHGTKVVDFYIGDDKATLRRKGGEPPTWEWYGPYL